MTFTIDDNTIKKIEENFVTIKNYLNENNSNKLKLISNNLKNIMNLIQDSQIQKELKLQWQTYNQKQFENIGYLDKKAISITIIRNFDKILKEKLELNYSLFEKAA
ncbi:MAG: hypothetical protein PF569_08785 [Candidatus Woesearchaeota archaeon]|jgi:xylose isomerase|nr:hypothetical protein [Candidatus Woesearchaeota archaeon]